MITMPVISTQFIQIPVTATISGSPYNPTADPVYFAFMVSGEPGSGDWHAGSWTTFPSGTYVALILVGPANGGISLAAGVYQIWLKLTDNPEVPVLTPDSLLLT